MNRNRYHLVFNKLRGLLMAVAETATGQGKHSSESRQSGDRSDDCLFGLLTRTRRGGACLLLGVAVLQAMPLQALAQIAVDRNAPKSQQPTVLNAANGVPQINIQTPNGNGVSRNTYTQFDVLQNGVILNNARKDTQTQLGGWVQGNPWLAAGTAKVILNEVNSNNPSLLKGYIEVAGDRAQVVIANPSGISCDGCGFVNANRATITTGTPILNGGSLDGYRVQGGTISINGAGMDASRTDYTDIIARAVQINAGVWANNLKVTAGANQVSADHASTTPIASTGSAPAFAIDVAALGGMYAGKIMLVGTEAGVGVRNAGQIGASAGEVLVTVDGRLENSGKLTSAGAMSVTTTAGAQNTGTFYAQGNLSITTLGDIQNDGQLLAQGNLDLKATGTTSRIDSGANAVLAAGIQTDGSLAGSGGNIALRATQGITALGSNVAAGDQTLYAADVDLHGSKTQAANLTLTADTGDVNMAAATVQSGNGLTVSAAQTVRTDGARVSAVQAQINAADLSNKAGVIGTTQDTAITLSGKLDNTQGLLWAGGTMSVSADSIDNHQTPATGASPNDKLGIQGKNVTLVTGSLDNTSSFVLADETLDIQASRQITNQSGTISSVSIVKVRDLQATRGLAIDNTGGTISAGTELTLASRSYVGAGSLTSQDKLSFTTDTDTTQSGTLKSAGDMSVQVAGTLTNQGTLSAGTTLTLTAATLDNQATGTIKGTSLALRATDTHTFTNRGLINGGDTFIDAITLNNLGTGRIYGDHVALSATTLNSSNENGTSPTIAARNRLDLGIGSFSNDNGALAFSAGDMAIGGSLDGNHLATGRAGTITNNGGTIQALGTLGIAATDIFNTNANFSATAVASSSITNKTTYSTSIGVLTNDQIASITNFQAWGGASLLGFGVSSPNPGANQYTYVTLNGSSTAQQIALYSIIIASYHPLEAQVLSTAPGQILSGGDMALDATQTLTNDKSHIVAGGALDVTGTSIDNIAAQVSGTEYRSGTYRPWAYAGHIGKSTGNGCDCDTYAFDVKPYAANVGVTITSPVFVTKDHQTSSAGASVPSLGTPGTGTSGTPTGKNAGPSTSPATLTVPTASLYHTLPSTNSHVLVATDPKFANYRTWLSSDYMLSALSLDPALTQKRLGDGFYEQQLIREQVAQLTGRRFLANYASDEAEYQALMTAGVTFAKAHNLVPGVTLSAAQVAQLTSDMVWLETQTVKLPDGSSQQVLVPHVYVVPKAGDLSGTGTLLAGSDVIIKTSSDLTNSGTVAGRNLVSFDTNTLNNLGGRIAGATTALQAKQDINNIGGRIEATDTLALLAGRDINVTTTTASGSGTASGNGASGSFTRTQVDRVAGLYVTGSGGTLLAQAGHDITLTAAQVGNSGGNTVLDAGNNLTLATVTTRDSANVTLNGGYAKSSQNTEVGSSLQSAGNLTLSAGQDLNARAAVAQAGGDLSLAAKRNISITAGESHVESDVRVDIDRGTSGGFGGFFGSSDHTTYLDKSSATAGVASSFSGGTVTTKSGGDTTLTGSTLNADKALAMAAGGDIKLQANTRSERSFHSQENTSDGFLSDSQSLDTRKTASTQAEGSLVSGDTVSIASKQNVAVSGSNVVATKDLAITAGKRLSIEAAENTYQSKETHDKETSGLFSGGGIGVTWGNRDQTQKQDGEGVSHTASTVGSVQGNVTLKAGTAYSQMGSSVTAPGGDISITAPKVDIGAVYDTSKTKQTFEQSQSGLSFTITSPVISAVQTAQQMSQAASQTKDTRMKALAAANTAFAAKNAADAVQAGQGDANGKVAQYDANGKEGGRDANTADKAGGINLSLSIGSSDSQSESTQTSSIAVGSVVSAGKNLTIKATDGDLTAIGSNLSAGQNADLSATGNINLLAAANTSSQDSNQSGGSSSIGIGFALGGQQNGFTLQFGASRNEGKDKGKDLSWTHTTVSAGNKVTLNSGKDTNLKGAVVEGNQVVADVGGNLNVETLQDTSTYTSKSSNSGFGASLCIPPFCYGTPSTVTVSMGKSKIDSNYQSAVIQAGIQAGDGGFQVNVNGNTDLKGAVLASNDKAIADNKNGLTTGTLTTSDLQNSSSASAEVSDITLSSDMLTQGKYGATKGLLTNALGSTDASSSSTGYANAAISGGSVVITDNAKQLASTGKTAEQTVATLNRDTANALVTVQKPNVQGMKDAVLADQTIKQESIKIIVTLTDEAYRVMFASKAKVYKLPPGCDNAKCAVEVSPEELQKSQDGKVHVSNNGIFTSLDDAIRLANQNAPDVNDVKTREPGKPTNQYLVYFPETNNTISELMVALYQKALEPTLGLSNPTQTNVGIISKYGNDGLTIDGHSRGSMTADNAMSDILSSYGVGAAKNLNLNFFGPAANVADADKTLSQLQDRSGNPGASPIKPFVHIDDFVGRIVGGNPATGGTTPTNPDGTPHSQFSEWWNILGGENTAHNCYGTGPAGCAAYWKDTLLVPIVKPAPTR